MKLGQTSFVHFSSLFLESIIGFLALVYIARVLGSSVLGTYFVVIAVIAWLSFIAQPGIGKALTKRISEGDDQQEYLTAALLLQSGFFLSITVALLLLKPYLDSYVGREVTYYVIVLLISFLVFQFIIYSLNGFSLVHIASLLRPIDRLVRSIVQVAAVFLGFGLTGMFLGYGLGAVVAAGIGIVVLSPKLAVPSRRHFTNIISFAKYSWLDKMEGRTFSNMDTVILVLFVPTSLVGIYEVSWNVASIFAIFSTSVAETLFPKMSEISASKGQRQAAVFIEESLVFSGLFTIPGLIGAFVVGDVVLRIYGTEFVQGANILLVLIFARLIHSYQDQFVNTLNAIDRPDMAFRVIFSMVVSNLVLNFILIYLYGWIGAAVATAASAAIGGSIGYIALSSIVDIRVSLREIANQWTSALIMGVVVYSARYFFGSSIPKVIVFIGVGAAIYFSILLFLSPRFRMAVENNVPGMPYSTED